jgi:nucleoside-diphosphate-sugar epimerase
LESVFILGYGWLGEPLGVALREEGYAVAGSTTSQEKRAHLLKMGLETHFLHLPASHEALISLMAEVDVLIITYPPSKVGDYAKITSQLMQALKHDTKVIFISSTSVYPDLNRAVSEEDAHPGQLGSAHIYQTEEAVRAAKGSMATILRCGGLIGDQRIPGKYFAGRKNLDNGHLILNLIHRDDILGVILAILKQDRFGYTWNLVAPQARTREELYTFFADKYGFEPPAFTTPNLALPFKIVKVDKLILELSYTFQIPDLLQA